MTGRHQDSTTPLTVVTGIAAVMFGIIVGYMLGVSQPPGGSNPVTAATAQTGPSTAAPASTPAAPASASEQELQAYRNALASDPKNLRANVELANRLYDAGRYAEAIPYYQQAFTLDSTNVNVSTDLATALYYAGRVDEALAQFDDHWRSIRGMGRPSTTWGSSNATPRAIGRARLPRGSACSQAIPIIRMRRKCARCWPS